MEKQTKEMNVANKPLGYNLGLQLQIYLTVPKFGIM